MVRGMEMFFSLEMMTVQVLVLMNQATYLQSIIILRLMDLKLLLLVMLYMMMVMMEPWLTEKEQQQLLS